MAKMFIYNERKKNIGNCRNNNNLYSNNDKDLNNALCALTNFLIQ